MNRSRVTGDLASHGNIFVDIANDRVGIGSTIPGEKLSLPDSAKIALGNSADLQIYHDGSSSYIKQETSAKPLHIHNTGDLVKITGNNRVEIFDNLIRLRSRNASETFMVATLNSSVDLYHDNALKFQTTAYGVNVTGTTDTDGLVVSGVTTTNQLRFGDSNGSSTNIALFGDSNDLKIYHNGSHSIVQETGSGGLLLLGSVVEIGIPSGSEKYFRAVENGAAELYHNNVKKIETTSTGVTVTGSVTGVVSAANTNLLHYTANMGSNNNRTFIIKSPVADSTASPFSFQTANAFEFQVDSARTLFIHESGRIDLHHDGSTDAKLSTSSTGINVSGGAVFTSTDAGSSAEPEVVLYRNSASPADADYLGQIKFNGKSDTGAQRTYAKITGKILDASNSTEDGIIEFAHIKGGSQNISARFRSDSLQLLNDTNLTVDGTTTLNNSITLNSDDSSPARIDLYCEVSNAHYTRLQAPAHSTYSGNVTVTIPNTSGNLAVLANASNNRVVTATGTHGMTGESNLTFNGSTLAVTGAITASTSITATNNLTTNGNLTVSSTNPNIFLTDTNNDSDFRISNSNGVLEFRDVTNTATRLQITSAGNIEIQGTRAGALQANDDDALKLFTKSTTDDINRGVGITFYTHDGSGFEMGGTIQVAKENGTTNNAASYMRFSTQSGSTTTERLRITSGGHVNIGTSELDQTVSGRLLNVYGGQIRARQTSSGNTLEAFGHTTSGQSYGLLVNAGTTANDYAATFRNSGGTTMFRVRGDGSVRVGDNSSFSAHTNASNLVVGTTSGSNGMTLLTGSGTGTIFFNDGSGNDGVVQYVHSASPNYMRIASSGHVRFDVAAISISDDNVAPTAGDLASGASFGTPRLHMRGNNAQSGAYELMARFQSGNDSDDSGATIVLNHSNDRGLALQGGRGQSNRSFGAIRAVDNLGRLSNCIQYTGGNGQGVNRLEFYTGESTTTTQRLKIDASGNVGVGDFSSTSISQAFHVRGSQPSIFLEHTGGYDLTLTTNDGAGQNGITVNGGYLSLAYNNKNIVMCRTGGKVGINESSNINGRLHVQHDSAGENIIYASRHDEQSNDKPILAITEAQMSGMPSGGEGLVIGTHNRGMRLGPVFDGSAAVDTNIVKGIQIDNIGRVGINTVPTTSHEYLTVKPIGNNVLDIAYRLNSSTDIRHKHYSDDGDYRGGFNYTRYSNSTRYPNLHHDHYWVTNPSGTNTQVSMRLTREGYLLQQYVPAFGVAQTTNPNQIAAGVYVFNEVYFNNGSHYSSANGRFTAPKAGAYCFSFSLQLYGGNAAHCRFQINGSDVFQNGTSGPVYEDGPDSHETVSHTMVLNLAQGDYVHVARSGSTRGMQSSFCGHLIG